MPMCPTPNVNDAKQQRHLPQYNRDHLMMAPLLQMNVEAKQVHPSNAK
jgi:hypothetical protein